MIWKIKKKTVWEDLFSGAFAVSFREGTFSQSQPLPTKVLHGHLRNCRDAGEMNNLESRWGTKSPRNHWWKWVTLYYSDDYLKRNDGLWVFGCYKDFFFGGGADESIVHGFCFCSRTSSIASAQREESRARFRPEALMGSVPKKAVHCRWWQKFESETKFLSCFMLVPSFFGPNNRFSDILRRFKGFSWKVWILASSRMLLSFCKITFLVYPIDP